MSNNFYGKLASVNFTVKNVSSQQKSISIFGLTIPYLRSADLMAVPEITEAEIGTTWYGLAGSTIFV